MLRSFIGFLAALIIVVGSGPTAHAAFFPLGGTPAAPGQGGIVYEHADRFAQFDVYLTDSNAKHIGRTPFTTVFGTDVQVPVPGTFRGFTVYDAENITRIIGKKKGQAQVAQPQDAMDGSISDLQIESLVKDSSTGQVLLESIFGRLSEEVGMSIVPIPDLYASSGQTLYSLVDLHQYLQAVPSFTFGEQFTITNGQSDALPGMLFSTTPFTYDPSSPTGFDDPPYSGDATADSMHAIQSTPEPSTITLLGLGTLGLFAYGLRRRKQALT